MCVSGQVLADEGVERFAERVDLRGQLVEGLQCRGQFILLAVQFELPRQIGGRCRSESQQFAFEGM